ncbi:hypothetical protein SCP_1501790 [Sparassis crispa]|uniref:Uncharacterized protein n=1 Tax=Sparassis crispa TaxID=139825 RepID=A0A401H447_9APHY|nr:hypothetical protein SCP_1501790 [Sparassis crispa]GBE89171.1 hypothetical protein SCP_1501790 [Sparassis crispa]
MRVFAQDQPHMRQLLMRDTADYLEIPSLVEVTEQPRAVPRLCIQLEVLDMDLSH